MELWITWENITLGKFNLDKPRLNPELELLTKLNFHGLFWSAFFRVSLRIQLECGKMREKCGPENFRIRTHFTQLWEVFDPVPSCVSTKFNGMNCFRDSSSNFGHIWISETFLWALYWNFLQINLVRFSSSLELEL